MKKILLFAIILGVIAFANAQTRDYVRYDLEHHYLTSTTFEYLTTRTTPPMYDATTMVFTYREGITINLGLTIPGSTRSMYEGMTDLGDARLADMDSAGIDIAVLSNALCMSEFGADAVRFARESNDSVAAAVIRHPDRFMGSITLPEMYVDSAIAEMNRCAAMTIPGTNQKIFRYWHLQSNFGPNNPPIWDPMFEPLFAEAERLGLAVYFHPNNPTELLLNDNGFLYANTGLGSGQNFAKAYYRLVYTGLFDRYPHLRFVLNHYGEFMPFTVERADHILQSDPDCPQITALYGMAHYVRNRNILMTTSSNSGPRVYNCAASLFDKSAYMFGSDYPFENYREAVDEIDSLNLSAQDEAGFWQNNPETYIINGTTSWEDTIPAPQYNLTMKTPTVQGYDFEHHSYIQPFIDTLAIRTEAPRYNTVTDEFYVHEEIIASSFSGLLSVLSDFGQSRLDVLNNAGPNITAVISTSEGIADLPAEQAIPLARMTNDSIYAIGQRFPGRFRGVMCLPLQNVDSALVEMRRCAKLGFRVWCIPAYGGIIDSLSLHIYEPQYEPLLAEAERLGITIYFHPQVASDADYQDMGYIFNILGFTLENMRTPTRLITNGVFDRYPNLRMIVAHLGEYFPFVVERMDNSFSAFSDPYIQNIHPISWYFQNRNVFVSTSGAVSKIGFDLTKEVVGVDGILFASDYPYENYKDMADFVRSMDITQDELDKIWGGNAERYVYYNLPANLRADNITANTADLSWIGAIDDTYIIEVTGPNGVINFVQTANNPYTLTNLEPNTEYSVRLRGVNLEGDTSAYTNTVVVRTLTTGVKDYFTTVNPKIYPNPTKGNIKIECEGMQRVTIYSIIGSVVYDRNVTDDNMTIDMSNFNTGTYIVNIYTKDGPVSKLISFVK